MGRKNIIKNTNIGKLNNTLLNNNQNTEEVKNEIKIFIMALSKQRGQDLSPGGLDVGVYCKWKHVSQALNRNHRSHCPSIYRPSIEQSALHL